MQKGCVFLEQYLILHAQSRDAVLQLVILMLQSQLLYLLFIITNVWTPHRQLLNKRHQRFNDQQPQKVLQQKLETLLLKDGKCINSNTWSMSTIIKVLWWGTRQWPAHTEHWYHSFYITNSFRINWETEYVSVATSVWRSHLLALQQVERKNLISFFDRIRCKTASCPYSIQCFSTTCKKIVKFVDMITKDVSISGFCNERVKIWHNLDINKPSIANVVIDTDTQSSL